MTINHVSIDKQIDEFARQIAAQLPRHVAEAVHQAFMRASAEAPKANPAAQKAGTTRVERRTPQQVRSLADKLCEQINAQPGETLRRLATEMDSSPEMLQAAVARLKRQGRIRTAGKRQFTTYFPMEAS